MFGRNDNKNVKVQTNKKKAVDIDDLDDVSDDDDDEAALDEIMGGKQ